MPAPLDELRQIRLEKLKKIRALGIDPYPARLQQSEVKSRIALVRDQKIGSEAVMAGRIMGIRSHGRLVFMDLRDESGQIQLAFEEGIFSGGRQSLQLVNLLDIGDFIAVGGELKKTEAGELTLFVKSLQILTKSLRPLPSTWYGLKDIEDRYRRRYLDLLLNAEVKETFRQRSQIVAFLRQFFASQGFLEVETPVLQPIYGGANASPFITHYKVLDSDYYLRISDELYLKRLIIGGFEKVFEIGHDFRNEGIDRSHNPEFTMLEAYQAFADYEEMMKLTEELFRFVAERVCGSTVINYQNHQIDLGQSWRRLKFNEAPKDEEGDIEAAKLIEPTFVVDYPKSTTPLCKLKPQSSEIIERFEPYVAGMEMGNAYSELNDPLLQKEFFIKQQELRRKGNLEAHPLDFDFIEALEYGLPPTGGLGIGVDRLVMLFTNKQSIKEVILFPTLRPVGRSKNLNDK